MGGHGGLNILPQKRWNGEEDVRAPSPSLGHCFKIFMSF